MTQDTLTDHSPDPTEADDLAHLATDLRLACQRISRRIRYEGTHDIAPHQASVLFRLETPRTPGELAEIERVSAPSMTRTLGCLVDAGLVRREPHPTDGRQVLVSLTPEGEGLARAIRRRRDSWMAGRLEGMTPEQRAVLAEAAPLLLEVAAR
ncbi:MarR family transcriptional regulator [Arsenicicoccus sp. MKL-02]|uniref:MarR family transcriptional regulator n=1 Tax=Arsenicicoccus cauae TaxID=2663847 RepID=A0A6I3IQH0_9MICO|nr:MarR family transcriptional regulator [Arsenicicoccus cauae]MTB70939.1 MarR family transcriptional regulator [Arsenicicoccus cauae]